MRRTLLLLLLAFTLAWTQGEETWTVVLEPAHSAQVWALIAGQVVRVGVQEGARVSAGDTLIWLDDTDLRLVEAESRLAYERAQRFLDRVQQLHHRSLLSAQELEDSQYQAQTAQLRWQRAQLDLAHTLILAPRSGVVAQCAVQVGDLTSLRQVLLQLIETTDLKAQLFLPLDQLQGLRIHQPVAGQILATGQRLEGHLIRLSPVVDPQSGSCKAEVLFPGVGKHLKPGTVVQVRLIPLQPPSRGKAR
jgi:RND family efflux transporter MFP subunit